MTAKKERRYSASFPEEVASATEAVARAEYLSVSTFILQAVAKDLRQRGLLTDENAGARS
jgi:hypothetical protein